MCREAPPQLRRRRGGPRLARHAASIERVWRGRRRAGEVAPEACSSSSCCPTSSSAPLGARHAARRPRRAAASRRGSGASPRTPCRCKRAWPRLCGTGLGRVVDVSRTCPAASGAKLCPAASRHTTSTPSLTSPRRSSPPRRIPGSHHCAAPAGSRRGGGDAPGSPAPLAVRAPLAGGESAEWLGAACAAVERRKASKSETRDGADDSRKREAYLHGHARTQSPTRRGHAAEEARALCQRSGVDLRSGGGRCRGALDPRRAAAGGEGLPANAPPAERLEPAARTHQIRGLNTTAVAVSPFPRLSVLVRLGPGVVYPEHRVNARGTNAVHTAEGGRVQRSACPLERSSEHTICPSPSRLRASSLRQIASTMTWSEKPCSARTYGRRVPF